ncbi:MAG: hypothetical protein WC322_04190 [Candidatus Paceibacterota bacterium]
MRPATCLARQGPDQQLRCARCGLVWDIDDPEPPACRDEPVQKPKAEKPSKRKPKKMNAETIARLVQIVAGIATTAACLKFLLS